MFDPAQFLLFLVIVILTILLLVLGIQVFLILRDLRKTIAKANRVLDNTEQITENVSTPLSNMSQLINGLKSGAKLAAFFKAITEDRPIRRAQGEEEKHGK